MAAHTYLQIQILALMAGAQEFCREYAPNRKPCSFLNQYCQGIQKSIWVRNIHTRMAGFIIKFMCSLQSRLALVGSQTDRVQVDHELHVTKIQTTDSHSIMQFRGKKIFIQIKKNSIHGYRQPRVFCLKQKVTLSCRLRKSTTLFSVVQARGIFFFFLQHTDVESPTPVLGLPSFPLQADHQPSYCWFSYYTIADAAADYVSVVVLARIRLKMTFYGPSMHWDVSQSSTEYEMQFARCWRVFGCLKKIVRY